MPKRGNSEGSITKRQDGRWMARVSLPDGKRKAYYGKTRQEVAQKLLKARTALSDGLPLPDERQRTGPFLEAWLRDTAAHKVRPKVFHRYEGLVRLYLAPEIGRVPLAKLTPQHVERMLANVLAKGSSAWTASYCRAVLRNCLNHAMRLDLVGRNVAALAGAPKVPEREFQALTPQSARSILEAVKGDRLEALFTVALACGLRQSESLGLKWGDAQLDTGVLAIRRTLQRVNGAFAFFPPKSARSRRTISLPVPVAASLRQHAIRQLEERLSVGAAWEGGEWGDLMFTDEVGRPLAYYHVRHRFYNLLRLAGLPQMRYHDLRHGAASLMAAQGVPARVAMEILGHAQISTTMNIYTHVAPELQKEAAEKMAGALWPEVGGLVSKLVSNPASRAGMGRN